MTDLHGEANREIVAVEFGAVESSERCPVAEIKRWQRQRYLDTPTASEQLMEMFIHKEQ